MSRSLKARSTNRIEQNSKSRLFETFGTVSWIFFSFPCLLMSGGSFGVHIGHRNKLVSFMCFIIHARALASHFQCTHTVCTLARKHYAHTRANACNLFYMHAYTQLPYSVKPRLCISRAFECWASLVALACKMESQWKYAAHATRLGAPTMQRLARGVPFVGVYVVWPRIPTSG